MSGQSQPSFAAPPAMAGPSNLQPSVAPPIPVSSSARVPPPLPADAASRSASQSSSGQSIAAATAAPLPNVLEQLKQLGALRDAGVVTAEEFENKKADLLKRL